MYTAIDYCKIMEHLIQRWRVADLTGLNPKAAEAQEFVCNLPARIRRLAERKAGERPRQPAPLPATNAWPARGCGGICDSLQAAQRAGTRAA